MQLSSNSKFRFLFFTFSLFVSFNLIAYATKDLTLEEKIGQMLIVHFNGEEVNEDAHTLIKDVYVGGFIYYNWANGLNSPEQVSKLSKDLQKIAKETRLSIPLFISTDQEGGRVARLQNGFTKFPGNQALGQTGEPQNAEKAAYIIGKEIKEVGVNFNLAPVVDVNSNPKNPVIGSRSFGSTPEVVIAFGEKALEGFHKAGVITSLKHYPGYGDVAIDPHEDLPVINKSLEQLKQIELLPFAKLAPHADTIMTAHIIVPAFDKKNCATLSKSCLGYLRNEIGFKGIIISDSLVMEGLLKNCSNVEEAAIRAIDAGCDLLILGGKQLIGTHANFELTTPDVVRIFHALIKAVQEGRLNEKRIDESVQRILDLKGRYNL